MNHWFAPSPLTSSSTFNTSPVYGHYPEPKSPIEGHFLNISNIALTWLPQQIGQSLYSPQYPVYHYEVENWFVSMVVVLCAPTMTPECLRCYNKPKAGCSCLKQQIIALETQVLGCCSLHYCKTHSTSYSPLSHACIYQMVQHTPSSWARPATPSWKPTQLSSSGWLSAFCSWQFGGYCLTVNFLSLLDKVHLSLAQSRQYHLCIPARRPYHHSQFIKAVDDLLTKCGPTYSNWPNSSMTRDISVLPPFPCAVLLFLIDAHPGWVGFNLLMLQPGSKVWRCQSMIQKGLCNTAVLSYRPLLENIAQCLVVRVAGFQGHLEDFVNK